MYFYHYNAHGDVIALTDAQGNVVARYEYDTWGQIRSQTGALATENPYRYAGYQYDEETGLYYLIARYYHPTHGVFLSMDPDPGDSDDILTQNGYTYANNNPVMLFDPDGHYVQFIIWGYRGYKLYKGYQKYKKIKNISKLNKIKKGTGTYVIKFRSGYRYIGKGSYKRAKYSARSKEKKYGDKVKYRAWRPARSDDEAFIREYKLMMKYKFKQGGKLYNKIHSPGRKKYYNYYGEY